MNESKYKVKRVNSDSVIACVLGGISIIGILAAALISYHFNGKGPLVVGLLGVGSSIFGVIGFLFSLCSWRSVSGSLVVKRIGAIVTALPAVVSILLFMIGVVQ